MTDIEHISRKGTGVPISWFLVPEESELPDDLQGLFRKAREKSGFVPNGAARITYQGVSEMSARELLRVPVDDEEKSAMDEAKDFIRDALAGRDMAAKTIQREAREAGIKETTLQRAKRALRVESVKEADGSWTWKRLPQTDTPSSRQGRDGHLDHLDNLDHVAKVAKGEHLEHLATPGPPTTSTTTKEKAYIREDSQDSQDGHGHVDTLLATAPRPAPNESNGARPPGQHGQGGQKCIHDFPGGKGCYLCDPNHPMRTGAS